MPIDDYSWMNCRKCGHRYAKHIPKCPRCNEKTSRVSGKIAVGIIAGVVAVGLVFAITSGAFVSAGESNLKSVGDQLGSVIPNAGTKEPIATWDNCYSDIAGEVNTKCYEEGEGPYSGTSTIVKTFRFKNPQELDGVIGVATKTVVYQYGSNDFEIALFDQVGEKRYPVKLWELP